VTSGAAAREMVAILPAERSAMPEPEIVMTGLTLGESPRWRDGRLWVCNWIGGQVLAIALDGHGEMICTVPTPIPFSIDWDGDGRLLVVSGQEGKLLRLEEDGSFTAVADLGAISPHPWNELVVDSRGNAYVNTIGFDMMGGGQPAPGAIALVTPDGAAREVLRGGMFPNGMAITPDDATLIVAESYGRRLTAFDIADDGSLRNGRVWADLGDGVPDGICLDASGAVWYADVPNRRCVRVREGGEVLDTVTLDRGCFACMLGGDDRRTLCITAAEWGGSEGIGDGDPTGQVVAVEVEVPGAGRP
jgi:sugar lactone lactonase YvrE